MDKKAKVNASILIIGNEILSGRTQDTNTSTLAIWLNSIGVNVAEVRVIPDVEKTIIDTVHELRIRYNYVFTTGGIGPTHDDITAESISKAFNIKPSLLRFWEKEFDILKPKKNISGTRKYSSVDLKNIKLIYDLVKVKGYTLEGAKKQLESSKEIFEVVKKLEKIKSKLINIEKEL